MVKASLLVCFSLLFVVSTASQKGNICSGVPGIPGLHGAPGRDGRDGAKGDRGETGRGEKGEKGDAGEMGIRGVKGSRGVQGDAVQVNWKQCVWDRSDSKDTGVIQHCQFRKRLDNSALRVAYAGNMLVLCGSNPNCCSRWYFTFNGRECSGPMTIEGIVYFHRTGHNGHHHRQIEGYCENIPAGHINVAFHVGNCARWNSRTYDAYTGFITASRIMIEETPPAQQ